MSSSPLPHQLGYKARRHVSDGVRERDSVPARSRKGTDLYAQETIDSESLLVLLF